MKKHKKLKKDELIWREGNKYKPTVKESVLTLLASLVDAAEVFTVSKAESRKLLSKYWGGNYTPGRASRAIYSLKVNGYIRDCGESIELTDKAKIKTIDILSKNYNDNGSNPRFVSFDIPEDLKNSRNYFRCALKKMGFKQVQKSLWVVDRNVGNLVDIASKYYNVDKYVVYIKAESTNIEKHLKQILSS